MKTKGYALSVFSSSPHRGEGSVVPMRSMGRGEKDLRLLRCAAAALFIAVLIDAAPVFSAGQEVNTDKVTIDPAKAGAEMREALDSIKRAGPSDENMIKLEKAIEAGPVRLDATALPDIAAAYAKRGIAGRPFNTTRNF